MPSTSGFSVQLADVETLLVARTLTRADSGKAFIAGAVDLVVQLPAVEPSLKGVFYEFFVLVPSATTGLSISPSALDQIKMKGIVSADDKDIINTAASDALGDTLYIICDGADWIVSSFLGTFARQA